MTWTNTTAAIFRHKQSLLWKAWNRGQPLQRLGQALRDRNRRCHGHHGRHHHRHHRHDDYRRGDGTGQRGHKMWTLRPEHPTMTKHHVFIAPHSCDIRSNMGPTSHDIIISSCYQNWSKHQMKKSLWSPVHLPANKYGHQIMFVTTINRNYFKKRYNPPLCSFLSSLDFFSCWPIKL